MADLTTESAAPALKQYYSKQSTNMEDAWLKHMMSKGLLGRKKKKKKKKDK